MPACGIQFINHVLPPDDAGVQEPLSCGLTIPAFSYIGQTAHALRKSVWSVREGYVGKITGLAAWGLYAIQNAEDRNVAWAFEKRISSASNYIATVQSPGAGRCSMQDANNGRGRVDHSFVDAWRKLGFEGVHLNG